MRNPLRAWLIRRVLADAFTFEADMSRAYENALRGLEGSSLGEQLAGLLREEREHRSLLERIASGRIPGGELERILEDTHIHRAEAVEPLPPDELAIHGRRLAVIEKVEEESFVFYSNLSRLSRIPAVRRALRFMAEQERQHLRILRRLRGATDAEPLDEADPPAGPRGHA